MSPWVLGQGTGTSVRPSQVASREQEVPIRVKRLARADVRTDIRIDVEIEGPVRVVAPDDHVVGGGVETTPGFVGDGDGVQGVARGESE